LAIGGGRDYPRACGVLLALVAEYAALGGISPVRADVLFDRYGTRVRLSNPFASV